MISTYPRKIATNPDGSKYLAYDMDAIAEERARELIGYRHLMNGKHNIRIAKCGGRWLSFIRRGTPQFERQLARQHVARLNGEI